MYPTLRAGNLSVRRTKLIQESNKMMVGIMLTTSVLLLAINALMKWKFSSLYSRREVIKLLKPDPLWLGGQYFRYTSVSMPLRAAVSGIYTCWGWGGRDMATITFLSLAQKLKSGEIEYPSKRVRRKVQEIAKGGVPSGTRIPCFKYGDWVMHMNRSQDLKQDYDAFFVEDGNHRMLAFANLLLEGRASGEEKVHLYLGTLPYRATYLMHLRIFRKLRYPIKLLWKRAV